MIQTITTWLMTTISALTAFGVFLHDGHLDKAVVTAFDTPIDASHIGRGGHAHADYNAANNLLANSFTYQSPSLPPRDRSERRHRLQLPTDLGRHAFDDELMPLLA